MQIGFELSPAVWGTPMKRPQESWFVVTLGLPFSTFPPSPVICDNTVSSVWIKIWIQQNIKREKKNYLTDGFRVSWSFLIIPGNVWQGWIPALVVRSLWTIYWWFLVLNRMVHKWLYCRDPQCPLVCAFPGCCDFCFQALNPSVACTRRVPFWAFVWILVSLDIGVGSLTGPPNWFLGAEFHRK